MAHHTPLSLHRAPASRLLLVVGVGLLTLISSVLPATSAVHPDWLKIGSEVALIDHESLPPERIESLRASEAGFVDLLVETDYSQAGDTIVERRRLVRLFLDTDGIESGGEITIGVAPVRASLTVLTAYAQPEAGPARPIDPVTVQVTDASAPRIFSDFKTVTIPCPGLRVGSLCAVDYERRFRTKDWPLPWAFSHALQSSHPIEKTVITIGRFSEPIAWRTTDPNLSCSESDSRTRCEKLRAAALPPDVDLRLVLDQLPLLTVGQDLDWGEVANTVGQIVEDEVAKGLPEGTVRAILDASDVGDDADGMWEELFRFASDDVRYLGFEQGRNAVVPHPPAVTLERRYGDCKDKVTLLVALARQAGLSAYPVLIATERYSLEGASLPSGTYFDHMVVCFESPTSGARCADPTVTNALADDSAILLGGRLALPLRESTTSPNLVESPEFATTIEIETTTTVACDGSVATESTRMLSGEEKMRFRSQYSGVNPSVRRRFLSDEVRTVTRTDLEVTVELDSFHDRELPIRISSRIDAQGGSGLPSDHLQIAYETWLTNYANSYRPKNINYPVRLAGIKVVSRQEFDTCVSYGIRYHGPVLEMKTPFGSLDREYFRRDDGLVVETRLRIPQQTIAADQLQRVDRFLDDALMQTLIWFELQRRK